MKIKYFYYNIFHFIIQLQKGGSTMKNRKDDLHTHSIHSDGSNTPKQIVDIAIANNVANLALTDHDNIEGSKEIIIYNSPTINIYSGVELTIKYKQGRMHLLGYNFDVYDQNLNNILREIKEISIYNILLYLELLKKQPDYLTDVANAANEALDKGLNELLTEKRER